MNTRPKPEKEEVMKTTKTLKAVAMICAGIILLQGYAAAFDQNDEVARVDNGARYTAEAQKAGQDDTKGFGAIILAYVAAPWGTVPGLMTVATGLGMIADTVDALIPDRNENQENHEVVVQVADKNAETEAVADLAANDRN